MISYVQVFNATVMFWTTSCLYNPLLIFNSIQFNLHGLIFVKAQVITNMSFVTASVNCEGSEDKSYELKEVKIAIFDNPTLILRGLSSEPL